MARIQLPKIETTLQGIVRTWWIGDEAYTRDEIMGLLCGFYRLRMPQANRVLLDAMRYDGR